MEKSIITSGKTIDLAIESALLQLEEEAAKAAAAKEYAAKKGVATEEEVTETSCMSGIPSRPYCKGRNYDPNRYGKKTVEE